MRGNFGRVPDILAQRDRKVIILHLYRDLVGKQISYPNSIVTHCTVVKTLK